MNKQANEKSLKICLDHRVDSHNVHEIQERIEGWIKEAHPETIVLDARELGYLSSAGLRLLLRVQKRFAEMQMQNVSKEVNEIFAMTGFDQILHIEKALREISVEGKELIGKGGFGDVYRIDPETVVKVFRVGSLPDI